MERRKDSKGRVLKKGESERKDGRYQYRYNLWRGKRGIVYAANLQELREKELEIARMLSDGVDYSRANITLTEAIDRYISIKRNSIRRNTLGSYTRARNHIARSQIGSTSIRYIKPSTIQEWFVFAHETGIGYGALEIVYRVIKATFDMLCNDEVIPRNPVNFGIRKVIPPKDNKRVALTQQQQIHWMDFIKNHATYSKYYDIYMVLLNTGMRVSELCALTYDDIDFERKRIYVNHQLVGEVPDFHISPPKTRSGTRYIPMTLPVEESLIRLVKSSKKAKINVSVDGYSGFVIRNQKGGLCYGRLLENTMRRALGDYRIEHPDEPEFNVSPHIFRHTFCTNMVNAGMDIKSVQYLMGHAGAGVTLNIYSHGTYETAEKKMRAVFKTRSVPFLFDTKQDL